MPDCIFYAIVDGDVPGRIIHEVDQSLAFLDANPLAPSHTLVAPEEHHTRLDEMPVDVVADLLAVANDLVPCAEVAVDADTTNIGINNGPAVGQEVDHVHVYIVPRFEGDGGSPVHAAMGERLDFFSEELADIEAAIPG